MTQTQQQEQEPDVIDIFSTFQRDVLEKKPPYQQMYTELRMMELKIRPLFGDLSVLDFQNTAFIETIWSLGKLDEFYQKQIEKVSEDQKTTFFRLFNEMYSNYHSQLNTINVKSEDIRKTQGFGFELEIFRTEKEKRPN